MASPEPFMRVVFHKEFQPGFTVVSADIEDHDRMIDKAMLVLDDPAEIAATVAHVDTDVVVEMGWQDEHAILFHGVVREVRKACQGRFNQTTVVIYDDGIVMHKERRRDTYHGSLSAIVAKILARYPTAFETTRIRPDPDPTFSDRQPLVQANLTDYEFLNQLALHYGARQFVEYDPDLDGPVYWFVSNKGLLGAKPVGALEYCPGASKLLEFSYQRVAGRAGTQLVAHVMDPGSGTPAEVVGPEPPPPEPAKPPPDDAAASGAAAEAIAAAQAKAKEQASSPPKPTPLPPGPADPARSKALAISDPTRILGWQGKGRAIGTVKMRAKAKVTIKGIVPWAEGDWYLGSVTHSFRRTTSGEQVSSTFETSFVATR